MPQEGKTRELYRVLPVMDGKEDIIAGSSGNITYESYNILSQMQRTYGEGGVCRIGVSIKTEKNVK